MALTTYNITGNLEDATGAKATLGEVTFTPYGTHDARVDGADAMLGPIRYSLADLPATVALTAGAWIIVIRSTGRVNGDQQFRTITRTIDLQAATTWGDIVAGAISSPPMTPTLVEQAEAAALSAETDATRAETAAASAEAVGTTNDTVIAGRIDDPASATRASLSATIGAEVNLAQWPVTVPRLSDFRADLHRATDPLTIPTYDGSGVVVHPSVLYFPHGWNGYRWWMAMTPYPSSNAEIENPSIVVSDDGDTWFAPPGLTNPIVASPAGSAYNSDPVIVVHRGTMHMWYRDEGTTVGVSRFLHMSSTDGITWTAPTVCTSENVATSAHVSPAVWHDAAADQWVMLAVNHQPATDLIQRATAPAPEGPWSAFAPCTLVGGPFPSSVWHIDAKPVGGEIIVCAQIGGNGGGAVHLLRSADQGATLTLSPKVYAYGSYKSSIVPMLTPSGLALEFFRGRLNGQVRRLTLGAQQDVGLVQAQRAIEPYVFGDAFTRADGAIGTADSGTAWTVNAGSPAIVSNQASVSVNGNSRVVVDVALADLIASMRIAGTGEHWLAFRWSTSSNYWRFGSNGSQWKLEKIVGGVVTAVYTGSATVPAPVVGDTVTVRAEGDRISVFVNGGFLEGTSDAFNNTATQVGFQINATTARIDNFTARRL